MTATLDSSTMEHNVQVKRELYVVDVAIEEKFLATIFFSKHVLESIKTQSIQWSP